MGFFMRLNDITKKERHFASPFCFCGLNLPEDGRAERCVCSEWAATLRSLLELIGLAKILQRVRIINAVMKSCLAQRVPGIDAERSTVGGTCQVDFGFAPLIADDGKVPWAGAVTESHALDLDGRKAGP